MCSWDDHITLLPGSPSLYVLWEGRKIPVVHIVTEPWSSRRWQLQGQWFRALSLTEGAAFVLCAFHGAIRQHLEVEAVSAVEPRDDALQLGLCRANTVVTHMFSNQGTHTHTHTLHACQATHINAHTYRWACWQTKQEAGSDICSVNSTNNKVCLQERERLWPTAGLMGPQYQLNSSFFRHL